MIYDTRIKDKLADQRAKEKESIKVKILRHKRLIRALRHFNNQHGPDVTEQLKQAIVEAYN